MAYRDEREALRARLEASEQRLRDAENALVEANQRAAAAELARSSSSRAARNRRGHREAGAPWTQDASDEVVDDHVWLRSAAVFWSCAGIAFVLWQLSQPMNRHGGAVLATVLAGLVLFAAPSAVVLRRTARRHRAPASASPARVRVDIGVASKPHQPAEEQLRDDSPDGEFGEEVETRRRQVP